MMEFAALKLLKSFIDGLFIGFGILLPIFCLIKTGNLKTLHLKEIFILTAVRIIRISGIIYALLHLPDLYLTYLDQTGYEQTAVVGDLVPRQILLFRFYPPVAYLVFTQLLWFKKLYLHKAILIVFSILLLTVPLWFQISAILRLSEADYIRPHWLEIWVNILKYALQDTLLFFFTISILLLISGKLKPFKTA